MLNQKNDSEEEDNRNNIRILINDISTFLYKSRFLSKYLVDKKQLELLDSTSKNDLIDIFEYNRSISSTDASTKYSELLSSINSLFRTEVKYNIDTLYYQYLEYTKSNISLNNYLNCLIMINYILKNFNDLLNLSENNDFLGLFQLDKHISILEIDNIDNLNSKNDSLSFRLEKIYENINKKPTYKEIPVHKSLILLVYLMSLDGKIIIDRDIPNLSNLIQKFSLYNKIYVSNIYISILQYIQMIIIINLYIKANKTKKNFLAYNVSYSNHYYDFALNDTSTNANSTNIKNNNNYYNNKTQLLSTGRAFNYNLNDNNIMKIDEDQKEKNAYEMPNCYLIDDEIVNYPDNNGIKLIMFQNYLKFFSFYYMSKNKIKFTMNLSIESMCEISKHFINKKDELKNDKSDIVIFEELDDLTLNRLNINDMDLLTKNYITEAFSSFNFKEFLLKYMDFKIKNQIEKINNKYMDLILKSNNCYFQEPVITLLSNRTKDNKNKSFNIVENLTIKDLYVQYNILLFYLDFYHKNKDMKKTPKSIIIKFNTFKFIFNREIKKIQIFFNFSSIKEKTLFHYLKISSNILKLEQKYEEIIMYLKEFKLYESTIRLYQTNFRSHQVNFFFILITKKLADFLEENKYNNKITILEMKFNNFNPNMQVYIKDDNMKQRNRMNLIKQMISNSYYSSKISVLNNYLEELSQNWNLIIISDKENDFKLLRTFEDNKIFFYISRDKSNIYSSLSDNQINTTSVSSSNTSNDDKKNEGYEYLNIIMYFKNDDQIFDKGLQFMDNLQDDKNSILEYKTTLICDRFYLESNILTEPRMKKTVKTMYNVIDDLFMIAKNIKLDNEKY